MLTIYYELILDKKFLTPHLFSVYYMFKNTSYARLQYGRTANFEKGGFLWIPNFITT